MKIRIISVLSISLLTLGCSSNNTTSSASMKNGLYVVAGLASALTGNSASFIEGSRLAEYDNQRDLQPRPRYKKEPYKQAICARYKNKFGNYSKGYNVNAIIVDGEILNNQSNSVRFNSYSKYAVIFWKPKLASVIELEDQVLSRLAFGVDQQGKTWKIIPDYSCLT